MWQRVQQYTGSAHSGDHAVTPLQPSKACQQLKQLGTLLQVPQLQGEFASFQQHQNLLDLVAAAKLDFCRKLTKSCEHSGATAAAAAGTAAVPT
jgi:hypothetical protein